ncbi:OmpA family protein [Amycolatopsis regifaucium]|uniref:OmpA family protein n=1 Tax=Amycolatopsis regifaucium TaxID=546365 RepID=UPI0008F64DBE|nr:OmpA family protein [Amycolatopsis regifaucium]SFI78305.1 OmpA family protein [Amycolatopsis regifaucium]
MKRSQAAPPIFLLLTALVTSLVSACGSRAGAAGGDGERIVILASASSNEPRPSLPREIESLLAEAAHSRDATDGKNGKGSLAIVTTADGDTARTFPLTPRRANGAVEHGLQRESLIEGNVRRVAESVGGLAATHSGVDLLSGIDNAVRGAGHGTLVVLSSGLSTAGGFDLRRTGWQLEPAALAAELKTRGLLPRLDGHRFVMTGLGATAGRQVPLSLPTRERLAAYWREICRAAGAAECLIDDARPEAGPPNGTVPTPEVPVPGIVSVTGPDGTTKTTLSDDVLGFAGDSAALSPAAQGVLAELSARIVAKRAERPTAKVVVRGFTADPPGSTEQGRAELSAARANAVAGALRAAGVEGPIDSSGGGTAPGMTAMSGGAFDEGVAVKMRRVDITY